MAIKISRFCTAMGAWRASAPIRRTGAWREFAEKSGAGALE